MARLFVLLSTTVLLAGACTSDGGPTELAGQQRTPAPDMSTLSLPAVEPDGSAEDFPMVAGPDDLLVVYFGYTNCPDVCPTTLADLRVAVGELGDDADRVEVAMATIDPGRDTPEVITPYVRSFFDDASGLWTDDEQDLRAVTDPFGVSHRVSTAADGTVEVEHSGFLYVVDDEGRLVVQWPFGTTAETMADDLSLLLDEATA